MSTLTLSADECQAIDWLAHHYAVCWELHRLLWRECSWTDEEWDDTRDITFTVRKPVARMIRELAEQGDSLYLCLARCSVRCPDLIGKLQAFVGNIRGKKKTSKAL